MDSQIVAFLTPGNGTYVSPEFTGAPEEYYALGLGECQKTWDDIYAEFLACRDYKEFESACDRVQEYYTIRGWKRDKQPVTHLPQGTPLIQASGASQVFFVLGEDPFGAEPVPVEPALYPFPEGSTTAEKISLLCKEQSMTRTDLAQRLGCTPKTLCMNLGRNNFSENSLRKIANILNCDLVVTFRKHSEHSEDAEEEAAEMEFKPLPRPKATIPPKKRGRPSRKDRLDFLRTEWHPDKNGDMTLDDYPWDSKEKVWWRCSICLREWPARIDKRTGAYQPSNKEINRDCPTCARGLLIQGVNDLLTVNPEVCQEWDYEKNEITPDRVAANSGKEAWWRCKNPNCGYNWKVKIGSRNAGSQCPVCIKLSRSGSRISLADASSFLAGEWDYEANGDLTPNLIAPHSTKSVFWKCGKGHKWRSRVESRYNGGDEKICPTCANLMRDGVPRDLASVRPEFAAQWHPTKNGDLRPSDIGSTTNKKVWWKCNNPSCGHEWESRVDVRARNPRCPACKEPPAPVEKEG